MTSDLLIAFGFGWMVVAALLGLYLGATHDAHSQSLEASAAQGDLAAFHRTLEAYKWRGSVHAHGMLFSLSSIVVGVILPRTGFSKAAVEAMVGALIVATVVWTLSALKRIQLLMGLGDLLFVGTIATAAWGIARNVAAW
jgi:hypothetical protein